MRTIEVFNQNFECHFYVSPAKSSTKVNTSILLHCANTGINSAVFLGIGSGKFLIASVV